MNENKFDKIAKLINNNKVDLAENELKNLDQSYSRDPNYLFLRGKIFHYKKLYYIAIDTLLIALEFKEIEEIYEILSIIYKELGNLELSEQLSNKSQRVATVSLLKDSMTGIYRKNK